MAAAPRGSRRHAACVVCTLDAAGPTVVVQHDVGAHNGLSRTVTGVVAPRP